MNESERNAYEDGRNYGWNEAVEILRLLRYASEEGADPIGVEYYTKAIKKLSKKEDTK